MLMRLGYVDPVLKELAIKDFKSFRDETIKLSPTGLTVLVGPNGSGKSTVLDAAFYATFSHFKAVPTQPSAPLIRKGAKAFELRLLVDVGSVAKGASFVETVHFEGTRRLVTSWVETSEGRRFYLADDSKMFPVSAAADVKALDLNAISSSIPFPRSFDVDLRALRWPLRPGTEAASFGADQVIQALVDMKLGADPDAFNRLSARVQHVVPALRGLGIQRRKNESIDEYTMTFNMTTGADIDASQVSEGTLLSVALLAAAETGERKTLMLIDDLDRALHPTAQRELVKMLRATVAMGHLEIICTTHSPYILSEFDYEQVRVLKEVDGASRCMSLADGPEASRWMKELDAGEYWSFIEHKLFQKSA